MTDQSRRNPPPDEASVFAEHYRRHYQAVLRFLIRRVPLPEAEDVAHEAFLIAWRKLDEFPVDPAQARVWLCAIARNCLMHHQRGTARHHDLTMRTATDAAIGNGPAGTVVGPEGAVLQSVDLDRAWKTLRPQDQEVIALAAWDELTSPQAAQVLGITAMAYRTRLKRARKALRAVLENPQPNAPPVAARPKPKDRQTMDSALRFVAAD